MGERLNLSKKFDAFPSKVSEIRGIWREVADLAKILEKNPYYMRPLKIFINRVEERSEMKDWPVSAICERLHDLLSNFWFPISSAASAIIPLNEQKKLALRMSSHLKKLAENIPDESNRFLEFDEVMHSIKQSLKSNLKAVEKANLPAFIKQRREIRIKKEWPQWKKDLITLIGIWDLLGKRSHPEYIMKSGSRSFHFFDLSRPFYDPRIREHFADLLQEGIEYSLDELKNKGIDTRDVLFIDKTYGEGPGTVVLSSLPLKQRYADIQSLPSTPWFDRIRGLSLKEGETYNPVVIDTLTTTGGTLKEILGRLREMKREPKAYLVVLDRSPKGLSRIKEARKLPIISLISFQDLLEAGIFEPEMLLGSVDDPVYLGLELKKDSIFEICKFYGREDAYQDLRVRMLSLIDKAFSIEKDRIFGKVRLLGDIAAFKDISINLLILSYNSLKNRLTLLYTLAGIEYIEYIEIVEKHYSPVLSSMSSLLKSKLNDTNCSHVEWDLIANIFATNWDYMLGHILKYVKELNLVMPKEKYSNQELKTLANKGVELLENAYRKNLKSTSYTFQPKEKEEHFRRLYKIYESFNDLTGKPYEEKFLGERFFEGMATSPKHGKHKDDRLA